MTTALTHPMVREYLLQLHRSLTKLPAADSYEIFNQIKEHLVEALPPNAADDEVAVVLAELGTPDEVAAAATPPMRKTLRLPWRQRIRWRWAVAGVVALAVVATLTTVITLQKTADDLVCVCAFGWADQVDGQRAVHSEADGHEQSTVMRRRGVAQGVRVVITNPTRYTQTILGVASDQPDDYFLLRMTTAEPKIYPDQTGFTAHFPIAMAPGATRTVELRFSPDICIGAGGEEIADEIPLRVRVGWYTRNENIPMARFAFAVKTTAATANCH